MKRLIVISTMMVGIGIVMGVMLVSNFTPSFLSENFALNNNKLGANNAPVKVSETVNALNNAFAASSNAVLPSVVSISVEAEVKGGRQMPGDFRDFFRFFGSPMPEGEGDDNEREAPRTRGAGSGVIISDDGYVITNNHVIDNAVKDGIKVILNDKREFTAKVIGTDPLTDLAVLKIDASGLQAVHFASIDDVKIGEWVVAVGNPLGLNSTVTAGIVSAIGRGQFGYGRGKSPYSVENYIQTDAAINPGNSGGGLFNLSGSLVGINTAIATETGNYIGYGFAIPIDLVQSVVLDLMDDGKIDRGYIGVRISNIKDEVEAKALGLDKIEGIKIEEVIKGKAGEKAGLEIGDVILEVDGKSVKSSNELQSQIVLHRSGDKVKLSIWRDGKKIFKTVTLQSNEENDVAVAGEDVKDDSNKDDNADNFEFEKLGFTVKNLDSKTKKELDVDNGVIVSDVKRYGLAMERGIAPSGVIYKADRKNVTSIKQLKEIISAKKPGDALLIQVKYKDTNRMIAIEIPKTDG